MSERNNIDALARDVWNDFQGSPFFDISQRDAESIARSALDSPAIRALLAEAWDIGHRTPRKYGPDNCRCGAYNEGECACGCFNSNVVTPNPYREVDA